ncbi:D-alanyl-D-alanine carboxypeptidase family protein [Acetivibrio saccincola]|jgi:D-alanyl-D-alanine carboxypeptidase/D-alanyl-D-alanine carboxypeptidase (penicillin-binding protein 5/6)|uniref:D-alanyl-D-alanine carboxypeptidase DacB n=1 Tax=Acetivibrio saccincola TaxID=1677857 RepID=A0A2K9EDE6_9FIRM|nr:D-alanyl-D-alanine carboxypeptidase family protein [Acetivibrio saccincola]AUG57235.1 D-alanyl-D-alanine carboxypeptidase DacB precursor [Acetivibrio saccincola]NLW26378.1 D-alanyl-D-alanine carboxypeptidase [Acetivibrio saccincola]HQD27840.1 D-alanyl-D-alanine carboxypeptidase family protein [Acetivibrio saccincola]
MNNRRILPILYITVFLLTVSLCTSLIGANTNEPEIDSVSAILIDAHRGQILFEKNPKEKLHISSANKIMTALLTIEKEPRPEESKVTISRRAVTVDGAVSNLEVGEQYRVEDLIYSVMLKSANDSANALAEYIGGSIEDFVNLMNQKAEELGMEDTVFVNPTGLQEEGQYTTAYDMARLMRYALNNPGFERVFKARAWIWADQNEFLQNENKLFWSRDDVDGGRIGFNDIERQTSITSATQENMRLVAIVLDSPEATLDENVNKLLDYGFANFKRSILVEKEQRFRMLSVGDEVVELISKSDYYYVHPIGVDYVKEVETHIEDIIEPPLTKEQEVGFVRYILMDDTFIDVKIYPKDNVYSNVSMLSNIIRKLKEYKELTFLIAALIILEIIIIIYKLIKGFVYVFSKIKMKFKNG